MIDPADIADASGLVDSHAHLDMEEFDADRDEVIRRAFRAGLRAILCPADLIHPESLEKVLNMARNHAVVAAAGVHPHQASSFRDSHASQMESLAQAGAIRAVGEIGLDFHYNLSPPEVQTAVFRKQLALAEALGLPAVVHSRNSGDALREAVEAEGFSRGGILHCFTEDLAVAEDMIARGFLISFSGILTFPGASSLRETAARIPTDRLLVETDAPYLTPAPFRKRVRRNEPVFVAVTAEVLAGIKNLTPGETAEITTENFFRLFPFEKPSGR